MGMYYQRSVTIVEGNVIYGEPTVVDLIAMSIVPGVPGRPTPGPTPPEVEPPTTEGQAARLRPWPEGAAPPVPDANWKPALIFTAEAPYGMEAMTGPYASHSGKKKASEGRQP